MTATPYGYRLVPDRGRSIQVIEQFEMLRPALREAEARARGLVDDPDALASRIEVVPIRELELLASLAFVVRPRPSQDDPDTIGTAEEPTLEDEARGVVLDAIREAIDRLDAMAATGLAREIRRRFLAPLAASDPKAEGMVRLRSLDEMQRDAIFETLQACGGSSIKAAARLGISVRKLQYKLKHYRAGRL